MCKVKLTLLIELSKIVKLVLHLLHYFTLKTCGFLSKKGGSSPQNKAKIIYWPLEKNR